jgi:hypothetical protein
LYVSVVRASAKRQRLNYTPWDAEENAAIQRYFGSFMQTLKRPVMVDFNAFMKAEANAMHRRTVKNVQDLVHTRITRLRKKRALHTGD